MARLQERWNKRTADPGLVLFLAARLRPALAAVALVFVGSTLGYLVLERYSVLDAMFMSMITLSTVGYSEVHPLDSGGRIFTMGVIAAGFATLVYAAATLTNLFTSGEAGSYLRLRRGRRMREQLSDHVIVVGFGRVGQAASLGVTEFGFPCLVIERNAEREQAILDAGCVPMIGDATSESDLVEAGIHRARALIAGAEDDAINLIITLTARAVRGDLRIISRVNEMAWQGRIESAGANVARSPYRSYGISLAAQAVTPGLLELHAVPSLGLSTEEVEVSPTSQLIGRPLEELSGHGHGIFVLGLRRHEQFRSWHDLDGPIEAGDVLVALGPNEELRELAALC
ncbi:MAG TPA: potassium channel protein [Acidimicrobiales bacterium]|nr:potassium channel protein [Acidimicrobiales bacterium]